MKATHKIPHEHRFLRQRTARRFRRCKLQRDRDLTLESDIDEARRHYQAAIPLYKQVNDKLCQANCIVQLAEIARQLGDDEEARAHYLEAQLFYKKEESIAGQANCIVQLAEIARQLGDDEEARAHYLEAQLFYEKEESIAGQAICIQGLGDVALLLNYHDEARRRFEEAIPLFEQVEDVLGRADCIRGLGDVLRESNKPAEARLMYHEALALFKGRQATYSIGHMYVRLALVAEDDAAQQNLFTLAREAWESIDRMDLVEEFEEVFGGSDAAKSAESTEQN